jgi:hypothetical protein
MKRFHVPWHLMSGRSRIRSLVLTAYLSLAGAGLAQIDSVDITFFYRPSGHPSTVYLPGEFNGWVLNSRSAMTWNLAAGRWEKTVRLRVGGPVPLPWSGSIAGAYQYKFNENGSSG